MADNENDNKTDETVDKEDVIESEGKENEEKIDVTEAEGKIDEKIDYDNNAKLDQVLKAVADLTTEVGTIKKNMAMFVEGGAVVNENLNDQDTPSAKDDDTFTRIEDMDLNL